MNRLFVRNISKLSCLAFNWRQPDIYQYPIKKLINYERVCGLVVTRDNHQQVQQVSGAKGEYVSKPSSKLEGQLLKLNAQYKAIGYLSYEHVERTVNLLEQQQNGLSNQQLTVDHGIFLLRNCGLGLPTQNAQKRMEIFEKIWQYMAKHNHISYEHYALRLQVLKYNKMPINDIARTLQELQKYQANQHQLAELYALLLEVCCCSGDLAEIEKVISVIKTENVKLTRRHYNALVLGYGRLGNQTAVEQVQQEMVKENMEFDVDTQTILIINSLTNGDISCAVKLLQMHTGTFTLQHVIDILRHLTDDQINNDLLTLLVQQLPQNELSQAEMPLALRLVLIEMIGKGYLQLLHKLIALLPRPVFKENESTDSYGVALLREMARGNTETKEISKFCQLLISSEKNSRGLHIATEYALRYNISQSSALLKELAQFDELRTHYFWPLLLHSFRERGENGIFEILASMQEHNVNVDHTTLAQYVLPRLNSLQTTVHETVKLLVAHGVKPSICISPIISILLPQSKMSEVIELLQQYNVKLPLKTLLPQLATLSINTRITRKYHQFAQLVNLIQQTSVPPQVDFVGQLLQHMLVMHTRLQGDPQALLRFIKPMQKFNLMLDASATRTILAQLSSNAANENNSEDYELIKQILNKMTKPKTKGRVSSTNDQGSNEELVSVDSTVFEKSPNQMTLQELENHVKELDAKGKNVRGLLRRYLQLCVRDGLLEKALQVKAQCDVLRVHESPGMCACIFDMYIKLKDMKKAQLTLERMRRTYPGFQLDEHKLIDYAALLISNDRMAEARQLLEEHAKTLKVIGGEYVVKNVWQLLKNVAENAAQKKSTLGENVNITRDTYDLLRELGYCQVQNTLLGPVIREFLLRGNLRSAVREFEEIAQQYKCTPLQRELLSLLVRLANGNEQDYAMYNVSASDAQQLLNSVCKRITEVHGSVNLNNGMLLAFCEGGTEKQLRRLLLNPEFSLNQENLIKNCEHLNKTGDIQSLLRLARAARGLPNIIDENSIYNMILEKLINEKNCDAALHLYKYLEAEEDFKVPDKFVRNLVQLLQSNNVEVPSNIVVKAHISSSI